MVAISNCTLITDFSIMRPWLILLLTIGEVSLRPNQGRVSEEGGGTPSDAHEYPCLVSIQKRTDDGQWKHWCGGAVIPSVNGSNESSIVLTAAHCIIKKSLNMREYEDVAKIRLVFGSYRHSADEIGEEKRNVIDMKYFPDWNGDFHRLAHDIALMLTDEPIQFSNTITPIRLPEKETDYPDQPFDLNVTIQNKTIYARNWERDHNWNGDSGSPLICKDDQWTVHGVTSFTDKPCGRIPSKPSVYAMVEPHIDWITQQISEWS